MTKEQVEALGYDSVRFIKNQWYGLKRTSECTYLVCSISKDGFYCKYEYFRYLAAYTALSYLSEGDLNPLGNYFSTTYIDNTVLINPYYKKEYYSKPK